MNQNTPSGEVNFSDLGLAPNLLTAVQRLNFVTPTPIQAMAIPHGLRGQDIIGVAQTGTGKTLAFSLPLLQQIARNKKQGLIILPTRELAMQVAESLQKIGSPFGLRLALLIGGGPMPKQLGELRRRPHIIVGTPGRMIDHMQHRSLNFQNIGVLVLDEADRMFDMGFAPQLKQILDRVPTQRQTMLFSATMPQAVVALSAKYLKSPVRVSVAPSGTVAARVNQALFYIEKEHKSRLLDKLLADSNGAVLVFSRTKHGAKKICRAVRGMGHSAAEIHSNLSLSQRRRSLEGFKSGTYRVLVATDIASRGIDVTNIELVINYELPDNLDDYVHRVGRTGRAGRKGQAVTFISSEQRGKVRLVERIVRERLRVSPLPALPPMRPQPAVAEHGYGAKPWMRRRMPRRGSRARIH